MASHKKQSEGIALLSIYGDDEDDEMEDVEEQPQPQAEEEQQQSLTPAENDAVSATEYYNNYKNTSTNNEDDVSRLAADTKPSASEEEHLQQQQEQVESDDFAPKALNYEPSPQQQQQQPIVSEESNRSRKGARLAIVDYAHDEMAMSPEPEEGEIMATGRVTYGEELQTASGDFQERTPSGTIQGPSPNTQATPPQSSGTNDLPESDVVNHTINESKVVEVEEGVTVTLEETKDLSPLDKFLRPPPTEKCSEGLQDKIRKFLMFKRVGRSYNAEVRNRKEYRNPDFLLHAVTYQDIDQIGSCFSKDVFDPHGYDKSDFYDELEADMRREMERREQERKKSQKVEFTSVGSQPGTVIPTPKINVPIPGLSSVPAATEIVARDGRQSKKSKWDKVDGDQKNLFSTAGQDPMSAIAANAAILSAANAGAGYSAFAQQRRREAEDKRSSSDKKLERRS